MPLALRGGAYARGTDGKMYILGGLADNNLIYDPVLDSWATGAAIPLGGVWESAATHGPDGRIYLFGGESDFPDAVYIYDPILNSWTQGPNMSVGLEQHGAVLGDDGLIYVIGGRDFDLDIPLATVNIYDPNLDIWLIHNVPDMPGARSQFGITVGADGKIYVIGGKTSYDNNLGPFFDDVFIYDPNTNTWSTGPDLLNTARGELAAAVGDVIYAIGGSNGVGLATNEAFTLLPPAQLSLEDAFGGPDGIVTVDLILDTEWDVGGIEFNLRAADRGEVPPPSENVSLEGIINNFEGEGWSVFSSTDQETGVTTGLVVHTSGGYFEGGNTYNVLQMVYRVDEETPAPLWIDIEFMDPITISDPNANSVPLEYASGSIRIGEPGDLIGGSDGNGDGLINILDIVKMINYIVGKTPAPDAESFTHWQADIVADGDLNILDLVWLINAYLDIEQQPNKAVADGPVVVSLNAVQTGPTGQLMIPVTFDSDGNITGAQISLTFDPTRMWIGEPILADNARHLSLRHNVVEGTLNLVAYSLDGAAIPAGNEDMVLIPVQLLGGNEDGGTVHLTSFLLADGHASEIPALLGQTSVKVAQVPGAFSLESATPNPFNPSTSISYEVPQESHITLVVYNMLGQEVIRLVDEIQSPARYTVTWHGLNSQGQSLASGIYLYRITSDSGYTDTRRMTLLK